MAAIIGCSRDIVGMYPHLRCGGELRNVFEEVEPGVFALDTDDDGLCVFAYRKRGKLLCCLHTVALALGLEVHLLKPAVCVFWPLAVAEDGSAMTVHEDALSFPCNTAVSRSNGELDGTLARAIEVAFGRDARLTVEQAARRGRTRIEFLRPSVLPRGWRRS